MTFFLLRWLGITDEAHCDQVKECRRPLEHAERIKHQAVRKSEEATKKTREAVAALQATRKATELVLKGIKHQ